MENPVTSGQHSESTPLLDKKPTAFNYTDLSNERKGLARGILYGYFILLGIQIIGPLILLGFAWNYPAANTGIIREITDLISGIVPVLSGVVGIAGIAVGYYFKS